MTAVHFRTVEVVRMHGLPHRDLALKELAGGVNVVYGPNASGKTTLARAMQRLLRPDDCGGRTDWLAAELTVAGRSYELNYTWGQIECRIAGSQAQIPRLAPAEARSRYVLALHDLVQGEKEGEIVKQILREAAGGCDLASAAESLGYHREKPRSRSIAELSSYNDASRGRTEAEKKLREIEDDARRLRELEEQREQAQGAQNRQALLARALDALDKQKKLREVQSRLDEFPEAFSRMRGDEWQRLDELKKKLAQEYEDLAAAKQSRKNAQEEIQKTGLPKGGAPPELVGTRQENCETLRGLRDEINRLERELAGEEAQLKKVLPRLGPEMTAEQAARLDAETLNDLFKFARKAEDQWLEEEADKRVTQWLQAVPPSDGDPDALRGGIQLLHQWLADQRLRPVKRSAMVGWLIGAAVVAAFAGVMALVHWSWVFLLILAAGLAAWPLLRDRLQPPPAAADVPAQWHAVGLPPPAVCSPPEVQSELRRLEHELSAAELWREKNQRFAELQERRDSLANQERRIAEERQAWRERLGIHFDLDEARLYLLADGVAHVQAAEQRVAEKQLELESARTQSNSVLGEINAKLAPYIANKKPAADADEASALVRDLNQRMHTFNDASTRHGHAKSTMKEHVSEIRRLKAERSGLCRALDLTLDDEFALRDWCQQRFPDYKQAKEDEQKAQGAWEEAIRAIPNPEELLSQPREKLQSELNDCTTKADTLDELNQKIGDIRGAIGRAKKETAFEAARAHEESCLDKLRDARDADAAALVGNVLVAYVQRQQQETNQPAVLKRAAELFAAITHGRYRLRVPGNAEVGFRAFDTSLGKEQNLDELSSGTRVQLLLSVRVAFVEQQEQGIKLPLIFDEALGNSDEQRAQKIIETAVELARQGRQVFYFTAQFDELGKWRRFLSQCPDVSHREFDLARLRSFSEGEHAPAWLDFEPPPRATIPAPNGDDWLAYGRRLNVPPIDRRGHVGGVHLWYLVDAVEGLHHLLEHGINKWGQFQNLVEIGSVDGFDRASELFRRAEASARLVEKLLECWRRGRGETVDRSVLEASAAVSPTFIDRIDQLAQSLGGDARRLIEELRAKKVTRFGSNQIDALEEYFVQHGFLDTQPILDQPQIREQVMPFFFSYTQEGLLSRERIDQLCALVLTDES